MYVLLTQLVVAVTWWTCQITVKCWFAAQVAFVSWIIKVKRPAYEGSFRPAWCRTGFWGRVIQRFVVVSRYVGPVSHRVFPLRGGNWKGSERLVLCFYSHQAYRWLWLDIKVKPHCVSLVRYVQLNRDLWIVVDSEKNVIPREKTGYSLLGQLHSLKVNLYLIKRT